MRKNIFKIIILLVFLSIVFIFLNFIYKIVSSNFIKEIEQEKSGQIVVFGKGFIKNKEISGEDIGILVKSGAEVDIENVHLHDNLKGIYIEEGAKVKIINSIIENNKEEGIDIREFTKTFIVNNVIRNNGESGIEMESENVTSFIIKNEIIGNEAKGIAIQYRKGGKVGGAYILFNNIENNEEYDLYCVNIGGKNKPPKLFFCKFIYFWGDIEKVKGCKWSKCEKYFSIFNK